MQNLRHFQMKYVIDEDYHNATETLGHGLRLTLNIVEIYSVIICT